MQMAPLMFPQQGNNMNGNQMMMASQMQPQMMANPNAPNPSNNQVVGTIQPNVYAQSRSLPMMNNQFQPMQAQHVQMGLNQAANMQP